MLPWREVLDARVESVSEANAWLLTTLSGGQRLTPEEGSTKVRTSSAVEEQ